MRMTTLAAVAAALLLNVPAAAQQVPSPADVLGYELGERFTDHASILRYVDALVAAAPDRTRLERYGETVEGRPLVQLVIGRADYLSRLDGILAANAELTRPETSAERARQIAATNPAVVYFSYGVHGNESSSSEAALYTMWDLLRDAPEVAGVLDSLIVVIDPAVNPDGRERYVQWYRQARSATPNPNPEAREHREPWPGGRFNHYLFDLNRDWTWLTQQETRMRLATWPRWNPQVHVDFHEMSPEATYFFFPAAKPINPNYPPHVLAWGERFGAANAAAFDMHGWPYFTGESYDLFYPGYGDSWPSLLGAIGMTYEQAGGGRAGLAYERADGSVLTLRQRAQQHRTTGQATLRTAAAGKSTLLGDYAAFHRDVGRDRPDILLLDDEGGRARALVALLQAQGIEVERAGRAFRADAEPHTGFERRREFPAGTWRVRARQSRGLLAATLLQPEVTLDATFSYDVSAWSLPFAYGVEAHSARRTPDAAWSALPAATPMNAASYGSVTSAASAPAAAASYGWVLPPSFESWRAVSRYLNDGGVARVIDDAITIAGREIAPGAIFLPRFGADSFDVRIARAELPPSAIPVTSGRTTAGPDLGTGSAYTVRAPRVALVMGEGVYATSAGAFWFFLDHTLGLDYDVLDAARVRSAPLREWDVIVLPEASGAAFDQSAKDALEAFVRAGGTLIAVGTSARFIAAPIADIKVRNAPEHPEESRIERALRGRQARELEDFEEDVPGTIVRARVDRDHPLGFGVGTSDGALYVLHSGGAVFEPDENFETAAYFPDALEKVSGVISERNLQRLSNASWLANRRVGSGRVILFADDPLFRHFWYGTFQPFANALFLGPHL